MAARWTKGQSSWLMSVSLLIGASAQPWAGRNAAKDNGPDFSAVALTDPAGFAGVDGIFRFKPDGTVERGLAIMEVRDGFVDVREPAPRSFDDVIY